MSGTHVGFTMGRLFRRYGGLVLVLAITWATPVLAQHNSSGLSITEAVGSDARAERSRGVGKPAPGAAADSDIGLQHSALRTSDQENTEGDIRQVGCNSCGGGLPGSGCGIGCVGGGCGSQCVPGRFNCCLDCTSGKSCCGRFLNALHNCLCCPDPCYEGRWTALADAAFFVDAPRPITQMRFRWDSGFDMLFPDKAEYFWARADGGGRGPNPATPVRSLKFSELKLYTEAAAGRIGTFIEVPYREVEPDVPGVDKSGFADLNVGVKSLLLDCELLQIGFQFRTYIPTGSAGGGLGTGHVSLEPSLLAALKLTPTTYLQGQAAYWIPIGGDSTYQGPIFHYHLSLNQLLWKFCGDVQLIATAELNGWEIMGGAYTDPAGLTQSAKDLGSIVSIGPGLRLVICDKIDFGVGTSFAVTEDRMAEQFYRAEFRWRF